ncbi:MAG: amidohydrolase [Candidatus Saganbacteria bacterium]|nr:amidohydrolase [Candidatus Saganbacteria bacterium]
MKADLLIKNALVLTMDDGLTVHDKADLVIAGPKIVEITPKAAGRAKKTIDASGKLVMPGLINMHTHAAMTLLRGLADDMPLDVWWQKFIFPLEQKLLDPEFIRCGVGLAALEMVRSGTTTFSDMYFYEQEAAEVCSRIGLRAYLGEGVLDAPSPHHPSADHALNYTKELWSRWRNDPLISIMVAPHAPYTCGKDNLIKAKALANELDLPLHIHVSETAAEVAESRKNSGLSPVEYLDSIGFLSEKVIAVHCVHLGKTDIRILKERRVKVVHCQESNLKLASGNAPIVELLDAGITVALGTDGAASNNNLDMFDEMDAVAKVHKMIKADPTVMDAQTVLKMATSEAARALGRQDIGSLAPGKTADIIILDLNKPHLLPLYNIYSQLVYSAGGSEVESVIINGRLVMENKRVLTMDEDEVLDNARHMGARIRHEIKNS